MFEGDARLGQIKVQVMKETRENSKPVDSYWLMMLMAKPGSTVRAFVGIIIIVVVVIVVVIIILHLKKANIQSE